MVAQTFAMAGAIFFAGDAGEQRVSCGTFLSHDIFAAGDVLRGGFAGIFVARACAGISVVGAGFVLHCECGGIGGDVDVSHRTQRGTMDAGARSIDLDS